MVTLRPDEDSWALGFLYEALIRALARGRPLRPLLSSRRGHAVIAAPPQNDRQDDLARAVAAPLRLSKATGFIDRHGTGGGSPVRRGCRDSPRALAGEAGGVSSTPSPGSNLLLVAQDNRVRRSWTLIVINLPTGDASAGGAPL